MLAQAHLGHGLRIGCCLVLLACAGVEEGPAGGEPARDESEVLTLDLETREVSQAVGLAAAEAAARKFVEIEVAEVHNPTQLRLTFEVRHRAASAEGEEELLGTFALFPPDNPGDFIVPTSGRLEPGGQVVVQMKILDEVAEGDELRVVLRPMSYRVE